MCVHIAGMNSGMMTAMWTLCQQCAGMMVSGMNLRLGRKSVTNSLRTDAYLFLKKRHPFPARGATVPGEVEGVQYAADVYGTV